MVGGVIKNSPSFSQTSQGVRYRRSPSMCGHRSPSPSRPPQPRCAPSRDGPGPGSSSRAAAAAQPRPRSSSERGRPVKVLMSYRVQVWSGQPCAHAPLASSRSSTVNSSSLSGCSDAGPGTPGLGLRPATRTCATAASAARCPAGHGPAITALSSSARKRSAARSRNLSRRARRLSVSPPPCAYLTQPAHRTDHRA